MVYRYRDVILGFRAYRASRCEISCSSFSFKDCLSRTSMFVKKFTLAGARITSWFDNVSSALPWFASPDRIWLSRINHPHYVLIFLIAPNQKSNSFATLYNPVQLANLFMVLCLLPCRRVEDTIAKNETIYWISLGYSIHIFLRFLSFVFLEPCCPVRHPPLDNWFHYRLFWFSIPTPRCFIPRVNPLTRRMRVIGGYTCSDIWCSDNSVKFHLNWNIIFWKWFITHITLNKSWCIKSESKVIVIIIIVGGSRSIRAP